MTDRRGQAPRLAAIGMLALIGLSGCVTGVQPEPATPTSIPPTPAAQATALPTRIPHPPGELVAYQARSGDTLPALAARFGASVADIRAANPELPAALTTLTPGIQMQIPAYYLPLTGTPFEILPDSELVNGPSAIGFDTREVLLAHPGYLSGMSDYAYRLERPAWEVIDAIASTYSIHPRLLLSLLEHQTGALSDPFPSEQDQLYPLGYRDARFQGLFRQLLWAAERLNDGYYGWKNGQLREFETRDGMIYRPDAWQNAGTVGVQMLFAGLYDAVELGHVLGPDGFHASYIQLWGDPFERAVELFPAQLQQPELALPFVPNRIWDFTGGPHASWGTSLPMGALDFAPPATLSGCIVSEEWVAAPAGGVVTTSGEAIVVLDLDGDGDQRTGWSLFFYHLESRDRIAQGTEVELGDRLGHPSCEGGRATGTHFHLARRYNGEWLPADGPIPFVLDSWVTAAGSEAYQGSLTKGSKVVTACTCSTSSNRIIYELPTE